MICYDLLKKKGESKFGIFVNKHVCNGVYKSCTFHEPSSLVFA